MKLARIVAGLILIATLLAIRPAAADLTDDVKALRDDVTTLRQGQEAMRKDLEEIKKLVQAIPVPPPPPPAVQKIDAAVPVGSNPLKGNSGAALTLIEFSDFQCPFCARHAKDTLPQLVKDYIETGKLRYAFRDFPIERIHPQAAKAAEAVRCAGEQGKFWEMHAQLFANQKALQPEKLPDYGQVIGLDADSFKACLESGKHAAAVREDLTAGAKLNISGTPSFILGVSHGEQVDNAVIIRGARPYEVFRAEIEKLLALPQEPAKVK